MVVFAGQTIPTTVEEAEEECGFSEWGCCMDGIRPALGPNFKGCQLEDCRNALYGCCPDGVAEAQGPNMEGCVTTTTIAPTPSRMD